MLTILLVEDDPHQQLWLSEELEDEGYRVLIASDSRAALQTVRSHLIDLAVVDLVLPDSHGPGLLQDLLMARPRLPVIIHTAYPAYRDDFQCWSADRYLIKSSNPEPLKDAIRDVLRGRRAASSDSGNCSLACIEITARDTALAMR